MKNTSATAKRNCWQSRLLPVLLLLLGFTCLVTRTLGEPEPLQVVYAVNAGGDEHTDRNGVRYLADPLNVGIASDYGKHLIMINRVPEQDEALYRTERYHTSTFGYDFPIDGDGDYALVMKFCEVYFEAPNQKVFDILLNRKHTVVRQLDIFKEVGHGTAHEEIVYFKVNNGRLNYNGEVSDVRKGRLRLDFLKGALDNPKINAFVLLKGDLSQVPRLPLADAREGSGGRRREQQPQQAQERIVRYNDLDNNKEDEDYLDEDDVDLMEELDQYEQQQQQQQQQHQQQRPLDKNKKHISGPRQPNPYSMDDSSILLPVFIAIGAFIPLLFCLCKL